MRILVLGGSVFLGYAVATQARERGHEVTVFDLPPAGTGKPVEASAPTHLAPAPVTSTYASPTHATPAGVSPVTRSRPEGTHAGADLRGSRNGTADRPGPEAAGAVHTVFGDRSVPADVKRLIRKRRWDAVVDTGGGNADTLSMAAGLLSDYVGTYVLAPAVDHLPPVPDDLSGDGPGLTGADAAPEECVRRLGQEFGGAVIVLNGGLVSGPGEPAGRLAWWLRRLAAGGRVTVPGAPDQPVPLVDVRDMAARALDLAEAGSPGHFTALPVAPLSLDEVLTACARETAADCQLVYSEPDLTPFSAFHSAAPAPTAPGSPDTPAAPAADPPDVRRSAARTIADTLMSVRDDART